MQSAELTSTEAPPQPTADLKGPCPHTVAGGRRAGFRAAARWLRRALADSARAWASLAGVPPDLYT